MIIDEAWAEEELEKQLRSLTPIDSIDVAEQKLAELHLEWEYAEKRRALAGNKMF